MYWALLWPEIENVFKNGEGHLLLLAIDRSSVPKKCITDGAKRLEHVLGSYKLLF